MTPPRRGGATSDSSPPCRRTPVENPDAFPYIIFTRVGSGLAESRVRDSGGTGVSVCVSVVVVGGQGSGHVARRIFISSLKKILPH